MNKKLIQKYNVPGPRYTSYPTVPYWEQNTLSGKSWGKLLQKRFAEKKKEGISIYIHLPFCEKLCTFCGCNKRITKKHSVEKPYIQTVLKEWELYFQLFGEKPIVKEIHLGGGTPTFFSAENLEMLVSGIAKNSIFDTHCEMSLEAHPNSTTEEHLKTLYTLGFKRISFGVQDYSPTVQKAINRIQPFEKVEKVTEVAREKGFTSISHDLVFGLPFQTKDDIVDTIEKTAKLRPDRIAFYSYAHVPWIKGVGQRGFKEDDIPKDQYKRELYEIGKIRFEKLQYHEIGMDHFSLEHDALFQASKSEQLHRNFMGYTTAKSSILVGLGVSSISDSWNCFAQNVKKLEEYTKQVQQNQLPIFRGHSLSEEDMNIRRHILDIMCHFKTAIFSKKGIDYENILLELEEMRKDDLFSVKNNVLYVHEKGKPFVRNICMAFDLRLQRKKKNEKTFSMTV